MERKRDIKSLNFEELSGWLAKSGEASYRASQIFAWLHRGIRSFDEMTDIGKALRSKLDDNFVIFNVNIVKKLESCIDDTVKYLYRLIDGECIESVLMNYHYGDTMCVSTQVGCRMGCRFCASCRNGLARDLTASEMLSQITAAQNDTGRRVSRVVMMGMGEPLDNYDNSLRFIRLACDPRGLGLSARHITLSTCGVVSGINRLLGEDLPITLSLSLHAPNDEIRDRIMPVNRRWKTAEAVASAAEYAERTGRRVSFEYALFGGLNDSDECAVQLAELLKGTPSHVNLIPGNHVEESGLSASDPKRVENFKNILEKKGIPATVRRTLGADINASCGQLRASLGKESKANADCKPD